MAPKGSQSVLITGCSDGGIGSALAKALQKKELHVFATARSSAKMSDLETLPNVTLLELDVTKENSIQTARMHVEANGGRLDFLINNAGASYVMPVLDCDLEFGREMFEANFWGAVRMTQIFSPMIMATKGCIVNICSINGFLSPPWMSLYNASKAAQESWSETLRLEMKPLGVRVITNVTGIVRTSIMSNSPESKLPEKSLYHAAEKLINGRSRGEGLDQIQMDADKFAREVAEDMLGGASGRTRRGNYGSILYWLVGWLPAFLVDRINESQSGLELMK